ncbi:MAG: hypothetical protein FWC00_02745 [Firmicutes bacterium]|nr:hypothetical protein [Bacillota bacterium]
MIIAAAVKSGDFLGTGYRHSVARDMLNSIGVSSHGDSIDGFLTMDLVFISREKAYPIAFEAGQLFEYLTNPEGKLISENIEHWDPPQLERARKFAEKRNFKLLLEQGNDAMQIASCQSEDIVI